MAEDKETLEHILELANFVSDMPLTSLTDENAFEPLLSLLFSDELATDGETDGNYYVIIARHLLSSGTHTIVPLLDYIKHEQQKTYGSVREYIQFQKHRDDACEKIVGFIGDFGGNAALSALLEIFHIRGRIQHSAISAIVKLNTNDAINHLIKLLLNHPSDYMRYVIAEALSTSSNSDALLELIPALGHPDADTVIYAIKALSKIKSNVILPFLLEATTDFRLSGRESKAFRRVAHAAIGAIWGYRTEETDQFVFDWSVTNLKNSDIDTRCFAVFKLALLFTNRAIPYLIYALDDNAYYKPIRKSISQMAEMGLKDFGTPEALTALENWKQNQP